MIPFERDPDRPPPGRGSDRDRDGDARPDGEGTWGGRLRGFEPAARGRGRVREFPARRAADSPAAQRDGRGGWLVPPLMLAAIAAGLLFVFRGPDQIFGLCFGLVLALGILWIVVSALLPGRADRTCPSCGGAGLERLDPQSTHGVRCSLCAWQDETASSFLLAEEEGPLEDIVLRERGRDRGRRW